MDRIRTIESLRGKTYAIYDPSGGMRVDLDRYLKTAAGREALERIAGNGAQEVQGTGDLIEGFEGF